MAEHDDAYYQRQFADRAARDPSWGSGALCAREDCGHRRDGHDAGQIRPCNKRSCLCYGFEVHRGDWRPGMLHDDDAHLDALTASLPVAARAGFLALALPDDRPGADFVPCQERNHEPFCPGGAGGDHVLIDSRDPRYEEPIG